MRLQGIFSSICDRLFENNAGSDLQLGLMGILSNLLSSSKNNHFEFIKINGYNFLNMFFNTIRDYSTESGEKFLDSIFELLNRIIFSGTKFSQIQNMEAFGVVLEIVGNSRQRKVVEKGLDMILRILKKNPFNCVAFFMMNGFLEIDKLLHRVLLSNKDLVECSSYERFSNFVSENGEFTLKSVKNFIPNEDSSNSNEEEKILIPETKSNTGEGEEKEQDIDSQIDITELITEDKADEDEEELQQDLSTNMIEHDLSEEAKLDMVRMIDSLSSYCNFVLNDLRVFDVPEIYSSFLARFHQKISRES